jgi:choline dehydrogenase-like flavoprotein
MLPLDMGGVVDTNLLVYRTSNLRVVDSGMFPLLPGSHIGAAVYAVSEKVGYSSSSFKVRKIRVLIRVFLGF